MPGFTAADGIRLYYEDMGTGLPILALAGLTRNARDFDHVAPHLARHRLIRMDYRGRGRSDRADPGTYTIQQEGADVLALLDHLRLPAAAVLGTSRGGLIGMGLAAAVPDRILGVCLNDVGPVIGAKGIERIKGYIGIPPAEKSYDAAAETRARLWHEFENVPFDRWRTEVENQFEETADGLALRYDARLRDGVLRGAAEPPDLWPVFEAAAKKPLALIRGANSNLLTGETAAEMRRRAPGMIFAEVPGRGHVPFLDEPEALEAIADWLDLLS